MLTKIKDGLLWGFGFSISVMFVFSGFAFIGDYITEPSPYTQPKPIKDVPYEILSDTHRIVPSSDEFKGGLVISGTVQFKAYDAYEKLEMVAFVTDENGIYVDTCSEWGLRASPVSTDFYFKVMCQHITSEEQFEHYEFELRGNKI